MASHISERIEYQLTADILLKPYAEPQEDNVFDVAADYNAIADYSNDDIFFPQEKDFPQRELIPGSKTSLYDQIQTDSDVERRLIQNRVQQDNRDGNVICYFKFPANFKIKIPKIIVNYNPDWGIIRIGPDGRTKVQLVREIKGTMNRNLLQFPNEKRKIDCATKHFECIGVKYRQVDDTIPNNWEDKV